MRIIYGFILGGMAAAAMTGAASAQLRSIADSNDFPQSQFEGATYVLEVSSSTSKDGMAELSVSRLAPGTKPSDNRTTSITLSGQYPRKALLRGDAFEVSGTMRYVKDGCREAKGTGTIRFDGAGFALEGVVPASAFQKVCQQAADVTLRIPFKLTEKAREAMQIPYSYEVARACQAGPAVAPESDLVGRKYTVYPGESGSSWSKRGEYLYTKVRGYAQTGPSRWAPTDTAVFTFGDKVTVTKVIEYDPSRDSSTLVEVARDQDNETAVVTLNNLVDFDVAKCPPSLLVNYPGRMNGLHVRVRPGAELVMENGEWHPDSESVEYAWCSSYRFGQLGCETRSYKRKPVVKTDRRWTVKEDMVEILTTMPTDVKSF